MSSCGAPHTAKKGCMHFAGVGGGRGGRGERREPAGWGLGQNMSNSNGCIDVGVNDDTMGGEHEQYRMYQRFRASSQPLQTVQSYCVRVFSSSVDPATRKSSILHQTVSNGVPARAKQPAQIIPRSTCTHDDGNAAPHAAVAAQTWLLLLFSNSSSSSVSL